MAAGCIRTVPYRTRLAVRVTCLTKIINSIEDRTRTFGELSVSPLTKSKLDEAGLQVFDGAKGYSCTITIIFYFSLEANQAMTQKAASSCRHHRSTSAFRLSTLQISTTAMLRAVRRHKGENAASADSQCCIMLGPSTILKRHRPAHIYDQTELFHASDVCCKVLFITLFVCVRMILLCPRPTHPSLLLD